jgi:16S rRNA (guanine(966)-N(2))-methyltransferase RsmD
MFEFKIIAGELKGKIIKAPDLGITRPPLSRLRKSIFDFLNPYLDNCTYLDLFSGSGSYLFEAVSRYASNCVGVELEKKLADSINKHAVKLGVDDKLKCICDDVFSAIPKFYSNNNIFDIIMIAPPQYKGIIDKTLDTLKTNSIYNDNTLIICQHDSSETKKIKFEKFEIYQQRKYGNTTFTILKSK